MIAIRDRGFAQVGVYPSSIGEMFELLLAGDKHWDLSISNIFFQARQLAASAVSENLLLHCFFGHVKCSQAAPFNRGIGPATLF
jgi:hypothetical protein